MKTKSLRNIGILLSCIGGLILIMDKKIESWGFDSSILAAILAIAGLIMILMANRKPKIEK